MNYGFPMNNYYNPYTNNQMPIQQNVVPTSLIRVTGFEGAKAYSNMGANSTVALFDNNDDIMYIKSTDGGGFPTIRTFRFTEETQATIKTNDEYVSKDEFEKFKSEVSDYVKFFIQTDKNEGRSGNNKSSKANNAE